MLLDEKVKDIRQYSPLALAFVGDGVYELLVREFLAVQANRPAGELHHMAVNMVRASAQAQAAQKIMPMLTEKELGAYRRGRNAQTGHTPKNATDAEYHSATGLEALLGYLHLSGQDQRIKELFAVICMENQGKIE